MSDEFEFNKGDKLPTLPILPDAQVNFTQESVDEVAEILCTEYAALIHEKIIEIAYKKFGESLYHGFEQAVDESISKKITLPTSSLSLVYLFFELYRRMSKFIGFDGEAVYKTRLFENGAFCKDVPSREIEDYRNMRDILKKEQIDDIMNFLISENDALGAQAESLRLGIYVPKVRKDLQALVASQYGHEYLNNNIFYPVYRQLDYRLSGAMYLI